jgi:hypothetical protein
MQTALPTLTANPINLNISDCISNMQSGSVINQPILPIDNSQPNGIDWMLDYHTAFTYYGLNYTFLPEEFGVARSNPGNPDYIGRYNNVSIVLNSNPGTPWNSEGNVDINTVLRHEVGHLYGLAEYRSLDNHTLMNPFDIALKQSLGQNDINGFRIIFEAPATTLDSGSVILSGNNFLYRINFPVIEAGPDFGEILEGFGFHSYLYKDGVLQSTEPLIPTFVSTDGDGNKLYTNSIDTSTLELGNYSVRTYSAMFWNQAGDVALYETHDRPYSNISFRVVADPSIESPAPGGIYDVRSRDKGAVTDTLAIKVRVPEVLGSYPDINIKIDGVYVNQGDIVFDSEENLWVYYWDLSTTDPTESGKRYNITAEIDGDPTDYDAVGVFLVEAIFHEDFETITNLTAAGWHVYTWHTPFPVVNPGWIVGNKVLENNNGVALSVTIPSATYIGYRMWTPVINLPAVASGTLIKLKYRFYFNKSSSSQYSLLKFCVTNATETVISAWSTLPGVDESWVDMEYDLTAYAGQSIKLQWFNNYLTGPALPTTEYSVDDIILYQTIDTSAPAIDFIAGNSADIDEDMNLNLGFNDNSGISSVTADYSIEGDSNTIVLTPVKGSYNYTGSILARDHMCEGSITFKIKDSVGNETVSAGHSISWGVGGILSAPENVIVSQPTSTTISITWDIVDGATSYKVFSSTDPYGTFTEDTTGTFTESRKWEKTIDGNKYFYYVIATNALKKEEDSFSLKIGHRVK